MASPFHLKKVIKPNFGTINVIRAPRLSSRKTSSSWPRGQNLILGDLLFLKIVDSKFFMCYQLIWADLLRVGSDFN